jgi:hypothetical protein
MRFEFAELRENCDGQVDSLRQTVFSSRYDALFRDGILRLRPLISRSFEPQASDRRLTLRAISFQWPTRRSGVSWEKAA